MTQLERQVRTTQRRLWFNRWLLGVSWFLAAAAGVLGGVVLVQRLFDLSIPLLWVAMGVMGGALIASAVWTFVEREDARTAAAALDSAAGLRERLSSAHFCITDDDPFAQAVVTDAERISSSLSARQHIRLVVPPSFGLTTITIVFAALMFLVPLGLLTTSEAAEERERDAQVRVAKVAVKKQMDRVKAILQTSPALEDLKEKLEGMDKHAGGQLERPLHIRHEALKKIDKLADAVKQKRKSAKYGAVNEMRKMLRGLKMPKSPNAPTQKMAKALARGDFKSAREEINALREQLATLKSEEDEELAKRLSKQLAELARQLDKLSKNEQLVKKLVKLGLDKEELKRALENLKKKDLDQIKKQLEEKGLNPEQIKKLVKKLQQKQQAGSTAKKLAQALKQASQGASAGQMGGSMAGLSLAADQLSELEQLEAEMMQLDAAMADLQGSKDDLGPPCSSCQGNGCSRCQGKSGNRGGMGKLGRGRGGLAPEQKTAIGFKTERGKVHTGKGAIIGQFLIDGEQVKGDVSTSFTEVVTAAERDASDRINRNRIPRQYHKAVKAYFSSVQRSLNEGKTLERTTDEDSAGRSSADGAADQP